MGAQRGASPSAGRILPIQFAMRNRAGKTVKVLGKSFRAWDQWVEEEAGRVSKKEGYRK